MVDATPHTDKILKLAALCSSCETPMNRMVRRSDLPNYAKLLEIRALGPERIRPRRFVKSFDKLSQRRACLIFHRTLFGTRLAI
jgi:hypothetical protein